MKLSIIIADAPLDAEISNIVYDSRSATSDTLFVCINGSASDGHEYAESAYKNGCRFFAAERKLTLPPDAYVHICEDTRRFLALSSAAFFDYPAKKLYTIGLTGTKGKTSICFMLKSILEAAGIECGIIGTTGIIYGDKRIHTENSTPQSYDIHYYFNEMVKCGCKAVVIEATSQGFMQRRTDGIIFDCAVFTNISPDHIGENEHKDFNEYFTWKKTIFKQCKKALVNSESEHFNEVLECISVPYETYGFSENNTFRARNTCFSCKNGKLKTEFELVCNNEQTKIDLGIHGRFSVSNALAAAGVAKSMGIQNNIIALGLSKAFVDGRMETVYSGAFTVIIDYAHNELSTKSLFDTIKEYSPSRIITVFGCGGNRSKLRRYGMGEIIGVHSDCAIITSDNPRFESVDDIIDDILVGMNKVNGKYTIIRDRKDAIEKSMEMAENGDVILIIGKGHQNYEEIRGVKYPFNEKEIILKHASKMLQDN